MAERQDDFPTGLEWLYVPGPQGFDPLVQSSVGPNAIPGPIVSFNAQNNISGVNPPDPAGEVGPNHFVAMSNLHFQIFDKTGVALTAPAATNSIWSGFGGACEAQNAGDPIVLYDQFADRWILTQFTSAAPEWFNCVAISQTPDPTGAYYRYAFSTGGNFPDYPKYGVWTDAYLISTREFLGSGGPFQGVGAYAVNRAQMIAGNPSPMVISFIAPPGATAFNVGDGLLPADIDGFTLPPPGSPGYFVGSMDQGGPYGAPQDALTLWKFVVDFVTPANSSFTLTNTIPIANYDTIFPCSPGARDCIPQPGTSAKVDILSYRQRPLNRLAYRNFGSHESLVTNQSVEAATNMAGIRWWELRSPNVAPTLFQEGTYAPGVTDGVHRWMGSIAMDSSGNMGLGYSASNGTDVFPSIRYTGRLSTDPLGEMPQGEQVIVNGAGSSTTGGRWGDYTSLTVDPTDDCTFWYVNEWYPVTSGTGWQLRVGSFRFNECGTPTFTMGVAPASQTICAATDAVYNVDVNSIAGFNSPVTLSASGNPAGTSAIFSNNPVGTLPGTSTLTIGNTAAVTAGTYPLTINGDAAGPINRSANVDLIVQTAAPAGTTLLTPANGSSAAPTSPTLTWTPIAGATAYVVEVATDAAFTNIIRTGNVSVASYTVAPPLGILTQYFWRVRAANACGTGGNSGTFSFTTESSICFTGSVAIPDNTPAGINNVLSGFAGNINDLNIKVQINHTWVGDLIVRLQHTPPGGPAGAQVAIIDRPGSPATTNGCSADNIDVTLDDAGTGPVENACATTPPAISGVLTPNNPLSVFNNTDFAGDWTLNVSDNVGVDTGNLVGWCLNADVTTTNPDTLFADGFE